LNEDQNVKTYAFDPRSGETVSYAEGRKESRDLLIETLYGPEHLNISTSRGDKVDDDASAGMARGNSGGNTDKEIREPGSSTTILCTIPMCIFFDGFRQI